MKKSPHQISDALTACNGSITTTMKSPHNNLFLPIHQVEANTGTTSDTKLDTTTEVEEYLRKFMVLLLGVLSGLAISNLIEEHEGPIMWMTSMFVFSMFILEIIDYHNKTKI
jgi:hypothetical protein